VRGQKTFLRNCHIFYAHTKNKNKEKRPTKKILPESKQPLTVYLLHNKKKNRVRTSGGTQK